MPETELDLHKDLYNETRILHVTTASFLFILRIIEKHPEVLAEIKANLKANDELEKQLQSLFGDSYHQDIGAKDESFLNLSAKQISIRQDKLQCLVLENLESLQAWQEKFLKD